MNKFFIVSLCTMILCACTKYVEIEVPVEKQAGVISGIVKFSGEDVGFESQLPLFPAELVKVELRKGDSLIETITTNREGLFSFSKVDPGTYQVVLNYKKAPKLTLEALVENNKSCYLTTEDFDCIRMPTLPVEKKKYTFIHLGNTSEGAVASYVMSAIRIQERFGGSEAELNNIAFVDCGSGPAKLIYLQKQKFIPDPDYINTVGPGMSPVLMSKAVYQYKYNLDEDQFAKTGDLGDYKFVQKKIESIAKLYPSDSIVLFMYGHGSGIDMTPGFNTGTRSISPNPQTKLEVTFPQLREVLTNLNGQGLNIVGLVTNACYSGMYEIGYELKDTGLQYLVASEVPTTFMTDITNGVDYIKNMQDGTGSIRAMCKELVAKQMSTTMAAYDLTKIGDLNGLFNDFAKKVSLTDVATTQSVLEKSQQANIGGSPDYTMNYYDMGDYARRISENEFNDKVGLKESARTLYNYLNTPKDGSYIFSFNRSSADARYQHTTGMTVVAVNPEYSYEEVALVYKQHRYYLDGNKDWDAFLKTINWQSESADLWDGTRSKPAVMTDTHITINKASELAWVAQQTNEGNDSFMGKTIIMNTHLDLNGKKLKNWIPIGTVDHPFKGTFDGNKFKIMNMYIKSAEQAVGLFGVINSAEISNCNLYLGLLEVDASTEQSNLTLSAGNICGMAIGATYPAVIKDCEVYVSMSINTKNYLVQGGSVAGYLTGSVRIENCFSFSSIEARSAGNYPAYIGGIVGQIDSKNMTDIKLINCRTMNGGIKANADGALSVGGIVGNVNGDNCTIERCFNDFDINAGSASYAFAGGVVGDVNGNSVIQQSLNDAYIKAIVSAPGEFSKAHAGGIVGMSEAMIFACDNKAKVESSTFAGGIAGSAKGVISSCSSVSENVWGIVDQADPECKISECYYTSIKGVVHTGGQISKSFLFSQSAWPTPTTPGWGSNQPTNWPQGRPWPENVWEKIGYWDASSPLYPQLGNQTL